MLNSDAVTRELLRGSAEDLSLDAATAHPRVRRVGAQLGAFSIGRLRLSDRQVALGLSLVLFAVGAWPLVLVEVPPYQDLPNHLATLTVIEHIKAYPEYVFNGFFKTNALLFAWLYFSAKVLGLKLAARIFAGVTLAANALVIPQFVLQLTRSRTKMIAASLFAWPLVHHWFVSMGMLDFAIGVPLSLALLLSLERYRRVLAEASPFSRAGLGAGAAVVGFGFATWYAHVFPLLVVHLLVAVEALRQPGARTKWKTLWTFGLPLLPASLLTVASLTQHVRDVVTPMAGIVDFDRFIAPWELVYNLWAECFWGYSNLTISSLVPCIALGLIGLRAVRSAFLRNAEVPVFFSPWALLAIVVLYFFTPYNMTNWFHVNSRLLPYFWFALLLYVPDQLPKWLVRALGVSALAYTVGMGVDYVRLDRERQEFTAGMDAVPEGSRLLPLLFRQKGVSSNTRNLLHLWGYYVVERQTSAPLLFAHSHSFPVTYRATPPTRFNHLVLEAFAPEADTPRDVCRAAARYEECDQLFDATWKRFWEDATPRFDHVLLWDATPEVLAAVPKAYERKFDRGRLIVLARRDATAAR
jgi:hypothetical protein